MGLVPALALCAVAAIFALCAVLWRFEPLRPVLTTLGAASGAFLSPLPGLLTPETRGKWLIAIAISAIITAGTWFAAKNLEDNLAATREEVSVAQTQAKSFETRLIEQRGVTATFIGRQDSALQDRIFLAAGPFYKSLFNEKRWQAIVDSTLAMLAVRPTNGHALYFAGEAYRNTDRRDEMRNMFQNYEAAARGRADARTGDASRCYASPDGFCGERLAWVLHLMANDYLSEAAQTEGVRRRSALSTALSYETKQLGVRKTGFLFNEGVRSSCEILRTVKRELTALGDDVGDLSSLANNLEEHCSLK
jgi:hypothetical protein